MRTSGLRRTEFNFRGDTCIHVAGLWAAKIEFCTSEPLGCGREPQFRILRLFNLNILGKQA